MMEFCVFFVIPFDENTPRGQGDATIEHARMLKEQVEEECLTAFHELISVEERDHQVWAQSRVDLEMRIVGVSLRLPIEEGAKKNVVAAAVHDECLYWDYDELTSVMEAMYKAVSRVAFEHGVQAHVAFNEVKYRR